MAFAVPPPEISWKILSKTVSAIVKRLRIDVELEGTTDNPSTIIVQDTARIRYQLMVRTHGSPKFQPKVVFAKAKNLGDLVKKAVSPSGLGNVDDSMRLRLYTDELPSNTDIPLNVDFEIRVDCRDFITLDFPEHKEILTRDNLEIETLITNNCAFPLEQISLSISKSVDLQVQNIRVLILDRASHNQIGEVDPRCIRKGDDCIKWATSFRPRESLLFRLVATAV